MNSLYVIILLYYTIFSFSNVKCVLPPPRVQLPTGSLEGVFRNSLNDRIYNSFEGIPYAQPPVGKHRFKDAVPMKPWEGTWKANTTYKCLQYNQYAEQGQDRIIGDEDCLYLNIYTPTLDSNAQLNVIVYIHGGAFMFNYGAKQGPNYLLDKDIVYVNFNYRLGPLGFLSTEDEELPGNGGLKDQILALKWIKNNIQYFGGNPQSITLIGMSAGGASVHLHYLIPKSKGLFHRGISQSGTALNPWVLSENSLEETKKVATLVGCPVDVTKQMVKCLRRKPARQIVNTVKEFQPWLYNPFSPFGVVVDGKWSIDPVLPDHPYKLLKSNQINDLPWIVSATSEEGLYPGSFFYDKTYLYELDMRWSELLPHILHYNFTIIPENQATVAAEIRRYYFEEQTLTQRNFKNLIKMLTDRLFLNDIEIASRLHAAASTSDIYFYFFKYRGAHSYSEISGTTDNLGVSHTDDNSYIFKTSMNVQSTENDKLMSKYLIEMLFEYGRTGKPKFSSAEWTPISKTATDPTTYLCINSPQSFDVINKVISESQIFWARLPFAENENLLQNFRKDEL